VDAEAKAALAAVVKRMGQVHAQLEELVTPREWSPYIWDASLRVAVEAADSWIFELREVRDRARREAARRRAEAAAARPTAVVDVSACVRADAGGPAPGPHAG